MPENIEMPVVSVVIPVYNGEKYLDKLYDCLSNQTYRNLDIVCVDDFSTDNSFEILQKFASLDKRFHVVKRDVKGGTAVKGTEFALPLCHGDFYFFLSQDDFIDYNLLEMCVKKALERDADVVLPNMVLYTEGAAIEKEGRYPINDDYNQVLDAREAFLLSLHWEIHGFALVRMNLVRKVGIKAEYYNSCEYYMRKSYLHANKIVFCDTNFYYRQDNQEAITKTLKYFHIDVLTTDYMLYVLLKENAYPVDVVKKRRDELVCSCKVWKNIIKDNSYKKNEKAYMKKSLKTVRRKLLKDQILYRLCRK